MLYASHTKFLTLSDGLESVVSVLIRDGLRSVVSVVIRDGLRSVRVRP
jgi:hypothetical protein